MLGASEFSRRWIMDAPVVTEREKFYVELFAERAERGVSMTTIAREKGIPSGTLHWWAKEIRRRESARNGGLVVPRRRTTSRKSAQHAAPAFVPVEITDASSALGGAADFEVRLRNGTEVRVPPRFDASSLRQLVEILGAVSC